MHAAGFSSRALGLKIAIPVPSASDLVRDAVLQNIESYSCCPVIGVSAPAGYGKTTLLIQYCQRLSERGSKVTWLHLDQYDDAVSFWGYMGAALSQVLAVDLSWLADAAEEATEDDPRWLNRLMNEIQKQPDSFVLFIDNYQELDTPAINAAMAYFLRYMPSCMRIVISSREEIPFITARLELQGRAVVLRQSDLSFSFAESMDLCAQMADKTVAKDDVWDIYGAMGGWPAGVKMLALALSSTGHNSRGYSKKIGVAGNDTNMIFSYLGKEVRDSTPSSTWEFLLDCALLGELNPDLCDTAFRRSDSTDLLAKLKSSGMFLTAMSEFGAWYRIHPLFREFLIDERSSRGSSKRDEDIIRRGANWLVNAGYRERAVPHLISCGEYKKAMEVVEDLYLEKGPHDSYSRPIIRLLERIPSNELVARPKCAFAMALSILSTGDSNKAAEIITIISDCGMLEDFDYQSAGVSEQDVSLMKGMVLYVRKDYRRAQEELLKHVDSAAPSRLGGFLLFISARCCMGYGDLDAAKRLLWSSIDNAEAFDMHEERLLASRELSRLVAASGNIQASEAILREASEYATRNGVRGSVRKYIDFYTAVVEREWCGQELLKEFIDKEQEFIAEQKQNFDGWLGAPDFFLELAKCYGAMGRIEEAEECFSCMRRSVKEHLEVPLLAEEAAYMRVKFWLFAGMNGRIEEWLEAQKPKVVARNLYERRIMAMARALGLLSCGQPSVALEQLNEAAGDGVELPIMAIAIDYHILRVWALLLTDHSEAAMRQLLIALRLAYKGRFMGVFAEWGSWLEPLLGRIIFEISASSGEDVFVEYVEFVRRACASRKHLYSGQRAWERAIRDVSDAGLSSRERQILELLVEERTVKEIASICGIKQSTAASHVNSIYRKLGVHNRREAIRKGHDLLK